MSKEQSEKKSSTDLSTSSAGTSQSGPSSTGTLTTEKISTNKSDGKLTKILVEVSNKQNETTDVKTIKLKSVEENFATKEDQSKLKIDTEVTSGKTDNEEMAIDKTRQENDNLRELPKKINLSNPVSTDTQSPSATESLLSVLEGEPDKCKVNEHKPNISENNVDKPAGSTKSVKRYIYRLKAKSGKVLKYTSTIPIVLKKPVITLTKMEEEVKSECSEKMTENETDDIDSDNSTKENNNKENDASGDGVVRNARKRGRRRPLLQKTPVFTLDDRNSSDTTDNKDDFRNKMTPSFTMQTRKRQLKFLPDGRIVTPGKKVKSETTKKSRSDSSTSESDFDSDEDSQLSRKFKKSTTVKKFNPTERKNTEKKGKIKKIFDFESYIREKSGLTSPEVQDQSTSTSKKTVEVQIKTDSKETTSKKITAVDPAQLLSSLIGVPISPSQLNIVKFKPKIIQERINNNTLTPKKVTFQDERSKKSTEGNSTELVKTTPCKLVSKPIFQKILPKPQTTIERTTPIVRKSTESKVVSPTTPPKVFTTIAPKIMNDVGQDALFKFDAYTDTKIVKTKGGPKKALKQKFDQDNSQKTIYDLLHNVFDQMPSWNLHIIPDTNSFCIAQVSRGRMGIPILKKSIELNSEFFAKVYVHQLHCKRYDGLYDTENKILTLIREIDALAA
ncbi:hypothetical protein PGB90_007864 [Kerria lacca]